MQSATAPSMPRRRGESHVETVERMSRDVLPRLPSSLRPAGAALLERVSTARSDSRLAHGTSVRSTSGSSARRSPGSSTGATAASATRPSTWPGPRFGTGRPFARRRGRGVRARGRLVAAGSDLHRLGPWHEVLYGLGSARPDFVHSGLPAWSPGWSGLSCPPSRHRTPRRVLVHLCADWAWFRCLFAPTRRQAMTRRARWLTASPTGTSARSPVRRSRTSTVPSARLRPTTTMVGTPIISASLNFTPGLTLGRSS